MPFILFSDLVNSATTTANVSAIMGYVGTPMLIMLFGVMVVLAVLGVMVSMILWIYHSLANLVSDRSRRAHYGEAEEAYRRRTHGGSDPFGHE